jgi:hypothetical protein
MLNHYGEHESNFTNIINSNLKKKQKKNIKGVDKKNG